jgi:hypothetical protein
MTTSDKLAEALRKTTDDLCIKVRRMWPELDPEKYSIIKDAREILTLYDQDNNQTGSVPLELVERWMQRLRASMEHGSRGPAISGVLDEYESFIEPPASSVNQQGEEWIRVPIEFIFKFSSKQQWINKAKLWFEKYLSDPFVCIDKEGNVLHTGEDFELAEEHDLYPVNVYKLLRTTDKYKADKPKQ